MSKPIGGVVKMYGGVGPNYFDGGVLIGDAGSFADPMTGEGNSLRAWNSALIASSTLLEALELGRFDAGFWPISSGTFDLISTLACFFPWFLRCVMRNWHFREFWMRSALRGSERAMVGPGILPVSPEPDLRGLNVHPLGIFRQVGTSILRYFGEGAMLALLRRDSAGGRSAHGHECLETSPLWQSAWKRSVGPTRIGMRPGCRMS